MTKPRILLADDHVLMCRGVKALLEPRYEVVGMVHDGAAVVDAVRKLQPSLLLLDLVMPNRLGLEICREVTRDFPAVKVLVVSMQVEKIYVDEAFRAGALGFVSKLLSDDDLVQAIETVLAGRPYRKLNVEARTRPPADARRVEAESRLADPLEMLSRRQRQVFVLMGHGQTTAEIADRLGVGVKAVEFHRSKIEQTLGLTGVRALQRLSMERMSEPGAPTIDDIAPLPDMGNT